MTLERLRKHFGNTKGEKKTTIPLFGLCVGIKEGYCHNKWLALAEPHYCRTDKNPIDWAKDNLRYNDEPSGFYVKIVEYTITDMKRTGNFAIATAEDIEALEGTPFKGDWEMLRRSSSITSNLIKDANWRWISFDRKTLEKKVTKLRIMLRPILKRRLDTIKKESNEAITRFQKIIATGENFYKTF